ncbi:hypothetical protein [Actinomadura rubrisoli]|uniref:LamG domain-containing protein n=1 Tax=Actinomadura rubrisoli TaxID=2530368 RepID=A0A4R5CJQ9_9ACTN|nr:hypothetical protein [Actinomadura rubrisoli]TDD97652.1 hypothetical protein E1298_01055 [Actinomadura rubrisoli]
MELNNGAEGGTNTTTVSAANSGGASGNPFDSVVGTPTITFDNTHALGNLSYKVVAGASAQQMVWSSASHGTQSETWGRLYLYSSGAPSAVTGIVRWLVGVGQTARLRYESTGVLTLSDVGNNPEFATANPIPTGQWVRLEWHILFQAGTGVCDLRTYNNADSTTPTESLSSATLNAAAGCDTVQWGSFNAVTWTGWLDGLQVNNTGFPGPITARPAVTVANRAAVVRAAGW